MENINIVQFRSQFSGIVVTHVDYNPNATEREKRAAYKRLEKMGVLDFLKENRPEVFAELERSVKRNREKKGL